MSTVIKLYETVDALQVVKDWLLDNDEAIRASEGEIPDELASLLEIAECDFHVKVENVALFIRELLANAKAVREERDRFDAKIRHYERGAESLKGYLKAQMERAGIPKIEGKLISVRVQKNPPSVKALLTQEELSSMRGDAGTMLFVKTVPESYTVDADYVKALHKRGEELPRGITVEQGTHVRLA